MTEDALIVHFNLCIASFEYGFMRGRMVNILNQKCVFQADRMTITLSFETWYLAMTPYLQSTSTGSSEVELNS